MDFIEYNRRASCPLCRKESTVIGIKNHHCEPHYRFPTYGGVYWIRLPHHTDPYSEGYIGQAKNINNRLAGHEHFYYRGEAIAEILAEENDPQKRLDLEKHYRPTKGIGWNIKAGG